MGKYKKFTADQFVSREFRSAVVLEEYLSEINNYEATRYSVKFLQNFNKVFKNLNTLQQKEQIANLVIMESEKKLKADTHIPEFVRTLLMNIIKTKFKVEILG